MATQSDSVDTDVNANDTSGARATAEGDGDSDVEVVEEEELPVGGTTEDLVDTIKKRFDFLHPKYFELTKMTKSTSSKKRSDIGITFTCCNCPNTKLSAGVSSVSNLRRHIKSQHPTLLAGYESAWKTHKQLRKRPNKQRNADETDPKKKKGDTQDAQEARPPSQSHQSTLFSGEQSQDQIDKRVLRFVLETNQAYSVVEAQSFKDLVLKGAAGKTIMTRYQLTKSISEKLQQMKENLKAEFQGVQYLCISADIWTGATRSFLGVTAHWISPKHLVRKRAAIACKRMKGRHTYDVIAKALVDAMESYNIREKTTGAVTDRGSNFMKSFRVYAGVLEPEDVLDEDIEEGDQDDEPREEPEPQPTEIFDILQNEGHDLRLPPHTKCAAHRMNNIAGSDVDEALTDRIYKKHSRSAMAKAQVLFKKQKKSSQAADHIRANCKGLLFVIPNATRWNSTYDAIKRLVRNLKVSADNLRGLSDLLDVPRFTEEDITFLKEYTRVYKHFADVLDVLQGEYDTFIGCLLPLLSGLKKELEKECRNLTVCAPLAQALINGIDDKFSEDFDNDQLYMAAAVHPRFKTIWITDPVKRAQVWGKVRAELQMLSQSDSDPPPSPSASNSAGTNEAATPQPEDPTDDESDTVSTVDRLVPMGQQDNTQDKTLLDVYMSQPTTEDLSSLDNFPLIKRLFIKLNTMLPSSATAERLFSLGGLVFGQNRHSYTDNNFEAKVLLKFNTEFWN